MDYRTAKAIQAHDREARVFQEVTRTGLHFEGAPIIVTFRPALTAHRGKLLSESAAGQPVFAGSFLRKREIVLDSELIGNHAERARILVHELFHFVWLRFGNPGRASWGRLLENELAHRARGELGWSSEWRKRAQRTGPQWRHYICESFCDTSAWMYAGLPDAHDEFTLAPRWRQARRLWFEARFTADKPVRV